MSYWRCQSHILLRLEASHINSIFSSHFFNVHPSLWLLLIPCLFHVSSVTLATTPLRARHTHTHRRPTPSWRRVRVSGDLFIFQHTQQNCPVPISWLSMLTASLTTFTPDEWLSDTPPASGFTLNPSWRRGKPPRGLNGFFCSWLY